MSTWDVGVDVNAALGFGLNLDATSPGDVFFFDPEPAGLERFDIPDVLDEDKFANLNLVATEVQASAWFSVTDLEFILENEEDWRSNRLGDTG